MSVRGGRIVTAADDYVADLYVEDETVTLIGEALDVPADQVIDAAGEALRPLPAQGHDRSRLGRGPRDLRPGEALKI